MLNTSQLSGTALTNSYASSQFLLTCRELSFTPITSRENNLVYFNAQSIKVVQFFRIGFALIKNEGKITADVDD